MRFDIDQVSHLDIGSIHRQTNLVQNNIFIQIISRPTYINKSAGDSRDVHLRVSTKVAALAGESKLLVSPPWIIFSVAG